MFGGNARLQPGELVRVISVDDEKRPLRVIFQPLRYEELHFGIIPEQIRQMPGYTGYELSLRTARTLPSLAKEAGNTYFIEAFRLTGPGAGAV